MRTPVDIASKIQSLTLGEVAKVEALSGQSVRQFQSDQAPMGKSLAALAFVFRRREQPDFTFDQALELTLDQAMQALGVGGETPDPSDAP